MTKNDIIIEIIQNLSRNYIINMSIRDKEKPIGFLLTYIRDVYGLSKTEGWDIAIYILNHYNIKNELYNNF